MVPESDEIQYAIENLIPVSSSLLIVELNNHNTDVLRCICVYCDELIKGPIVFGCEDGACRSCFLKNNLLKDIETTTCPRCQQQVEASRISASKTMQAFIRNLKLRCQKGTHFIDYKFIGFK